MKKSFVSIKNFVRLLFFLAIILMLGSLYSFLSVLSLIEFSEKAQASLVDMIVVCSETGEKLTILTFEAREKGTVNVAVRGSIDMNEDLYIYYDPQTPHNFLIKGSWRNYTLSIVLFFVSGFLAVSGFIINFIKNLSTKKEPASEKT